MSQRSLDDYAHERQALDAAHAQNEAGRDAFVALAHTALFAASVSFVGDVAPLDKAIWKPVLIAGWSADVTGLLALTFSFGAARRMIDARRAALNDLDPPTARSAELLNGIALWTFPIALLCLFSFVTANVVHVDDRKARPTAVTKRGVWSDTARESSGVRATRISTPSPSADARRPVHPVDWCHPRAASSGSASAPCSAANSKKVTADGGK